MNNNYDQTNPNNEHNTNAQNSGASIGGSDGEYSIKYAPQSNVYSAYGVSNTDRSTAQQQYTQQQYAQQQYAQQQYAQQQYAQQQRQYSQPQRGGNPYQNVSYPTVNSSASSAAAATAANPRLKKGFLWAIAGLVACIVIGITIAITASALSSGGSATDDSGKFSLDSSESPITSVEIDPDSTEKLSYAQIAAKFRRAVVGVTCYYNAYGWGSYTYSEGSGFIISEKGYIVTNSHVICDDEHAQYNITVTITDENGENMEYPCTVVGHDTRTDLAVLKMDPTGVQLVVAELGDSSSLVLGDEVVAIGNPGGAQFAGSITNGIVSGVDRVIDGNGGTSDNAMKYIQTNAAINPGNSGGPLLNLYGQVVGINSAKIVEEGYESLGFSIPINTAMPIIEELINIGAVVRPALGINCSAVTAQMSEWYDVPQGLLIRGISSNSNLTSAGVAVNDIITMCDGVEVLSVTDLQNVIEKKSVGETVTLTLFRQGDNLTFTADVALIADNNVGTTQSQQGGRP